MNHHAKEKSKGIDDYVSFSPLDLFAGVRTPSGASLPGGIDRLGVDDRRDWTWVASFGHASSPLNPVTEPLEEVQLAPFPKMVIHRLPRRKLPREHPPLTTAFQQIKHGIQQFARIMLVKAKAIKDRLDLPLV